jgi:hypothetical protein
MSFKFYLNGKEVKPPARVTWYFDTKPDARFESAPEKLEINERFWRKKLEIPVSAKVVIVETDRFQLQVPTAKITQEDDAPIATTTNNPSDNTSNDGSDLESSLPEVTETLIDSAKPKRRKKAVELPDLSTELDNTDNPSAE